MFAAARVDQERSVTIVVPDVLVLPDDAALAADTVWTGHYRHGVARAEATESRPVVLTAQEIEVYIDLCVSRETQFGGGSMSAAQIARLGLVDCTRRAQMEASAGCTFPAMVDRLAVDDGSIRSVPCEGAPSPPPRPMEILQSILGTDDG